MNKPSIEVLQSSHDSSFLLRSFQEKVFSAPFHFHPEYELTLILKGKGKRFVNYNMADYVEGDLVLLGANLPHCWKTEVIVDDQINAHSVVVQFSKEFLGNGSQNIPEFSAIQELLVRSSSGIQFTKQTQLAVRKKMIILSKEKNNFKQLMQFLEILQVLATSSSFLLLSKEIGLAAQSTSDKERINAVFAYIVENFREKTSLNEAAATANMSPNAFCRYFKKVTRKSFMETVIDYRINYATQQLVQNSQPVSQICFDSGFTDISHFYKIFKKKMNLSPLIYRKKFNIEFKWPD